MHSNVIIRNVSWPHFSWATLYAWCGPSANLECRSEMCCVWLAGNAGPKKLAKNRHLGTIAQLCRAISSQLRQVSTIGKNLVKQECLSHMSSQYGELWPTTGWDLSLRHPCKFQQVSRLGIVTAWHSSSGRQPDCGIEQRALPVFGSAAITLGIGPHF